MLYAAIITTLVVAIGITDELTLQWQSTRAIVTGPLVGLLLGDVGTGLVVGATIELMFLSNVIVGAAEIPDVTMASAIATALCITSNVPQEVSLPHTWNAQDALSGKVDYKRGIGNYEKRIFIRKY